MSKAGGRGWVGVMLDGTLATYVDDEQDEIDIGGVVPAMLRRVSRWMDSNTAIRVVDPRAGDEEFEAAFQAWCLRHIGATLHLTDRIDSGMVSLWGCEVRQVEAGTGVRIDGKE